MRKFSVVCCALILVIAACGSRSKDKGEGDAGLGGSGASSSTTVAAAKPNQVGTLAAGCGKGDGKNTVPKGVDADDTKGITADSLNIAVISDKGGAVKVPTKGIEESVNAFVEFCNSLGGINGRKLELTAYDSMLGAHAEVTTKACASEIFALVGTGSVLETGAQKMVDCKLVEVGAYGASALKTLSDRWYAPVPSPANQFNTGACAYIAEKFPDAVKKAGVVYTDLPAASNRAKAIVAACEQVGFEFVYQGPTALVQNGWGSIVSEMKDKGVKYLTQVSAVSETIGLLRELNDQSYELDVIDLGQQYYDPELAAATGAEGAYVLTNTTPFEEKDDSPAIQTYLDWLEKAAPGTQPTSLGAQAFSAGLLFAEAASSLGNDLTREKLLEALDGIHEWDGGGLHFMADPGANVVGDCFLYLQVKDAKFTRAFPAEGFECDPAGRVTLEGDYGTGAKEKP